VNAGELHRLARLLQRIAQAATANPGERPPAPSTVAVVEDIRDHPGAAIKDIVERVGLAQSLVSRIVERLAAAGVVIVDQHPADRRRTALRLDPATWSGDLAERGSRSITPALEQVVPALSKRQLARIEAALETLADELLKPESHPTTEPAGRLEAYP
jgi:DNA-binding MarR family transcriptional regulator